MYRDGALVGHTTLGGQDFRTGRSLCFAYVQCGSGAPHGELLADGYEIDVAGERFPLRALRRPVYDSRSTRRC